MAAVHVRTSRKESVDDVAVSLVGCSVQRIAILRVDARASSQELLHDQQVAVSRRVSQRSVVIVMQSCSSTEEDGDGAHAPIPRRSGESIRAPFARRPVCGEQPRQDVDAALLSCSEQGVIDELAIRIGRQEPTSIDVVFEFRCSSFIAPKGLPPVLRAV